jgi:hypothetical protein
MHWESGSPNIILVIHQVNAGLSGNLLESGSRKQLLLEVIEKNTPIAQTFFSALHLSLLGFILDFVESATDESLYILQALMRVLKLSCVILSGAREDDI